MLPSIPASLLVPSDPSVEAVKLVPVPGKRKTLQRNFSEQLMRRWEGRRAAGATAALPKQRPPIPRKPLAIAPPIVRPGLPRAEFEPSPTAHGQTAPETDREFLLTPKRRRPNEHGKGQAPQPPQPSAVPAGMPPLRPPRPNHEARKAEARQAEAAASRLRALEEAPRTRFQRFKDRVAEALPTPLRRLCRAFSDCVQGPVAALRRSFQP